MLEAPNLDHKRQNSLCQINEIIKSESSPKTLSEISQHYSVVLWNLSWVSDVREKDYSWVDLKQELLNPSPWWQGPQ